MYLITGGAGFIGSAFVAKLNSEGVRDILIADELGSTQRWRNLVGLSFSDYIHKDALLTQVREQKLPKGLKAIVHLGACSSTTERDVGYLMRNNYHYSVALAEYALKQKIRFIYASSAATYGAGEIRYDDDPQYIPHLRPLNPYGYSKQLFDLWVTQNGHVDKLLGLKYFNVYGPNEYHKDEMRSVVLKAYEQIKTTGKVRLFRSQRTEFKDGEQKRDFIYIKDCTEAMWWLLNQPANGIYNLGSGKARSWNSLASAVFAALGRSPNIEYFDMPPDLRTQYQYFTEARVERLKATGCPLKLHTLEEGIKDYVSEYLEGGPKYI